MRFEKLKIIKINDVEYNVINYSIVNVYIDKNITQLHVVYDVYKDTENLKVSVTHFYNTLFTHQFYDILEVTDLNSKQLNIEL